MNIEYTFSDKPIEVGCMVLGPFDQLSVVTEIIDTTKVFCHYPYKVMITHPKVSDLGDKEDYCLNQLKRITIL